VLYLSLFLTIRYRLQPPRMSNGVSYIHLTCTPITNFAHGIVEFTHGEGIVEQIQLKGLSLQGDVGRQMTKLETISASWVICDSWAGIAGTISLAIAQGGPVTLVYGPILILILVGCCALTLAELASVYPTAGGQYHWTSILAPKSMNRSLVSHCGGKLISPSFSLTR
jgi:hypothetical protein